MKTSILLICCVALFLVRISAASLSISVKPRNKISLKCKNVDKKNCNDKRSLSVLTSIRGGFVGTSLSLPVVKSLLQIALSLFNVACWAIPLRNKEFSQNSVVLSRANVYAGGIFLMLSFSHLIPHALEELTSANLGTGVALNCVLGGLLLMFFLEKVAFDSHAILHEHGSADSSRVSTTELIDVSTGRGSLSSRTALLLLLAMSLHSLFETVALGLATDRQSAAYMAASIGLHQPAESIALLIAFLKTNMPISSIVRWLTLFSFVGPIGVTCGVLIQRVSSPLVQAVVVTLTAGTFLYLGATEVLNEEFEGISRSEKWLRLGMLLAGIGSIALLDRIGKAWHG